jgi:spermidine synthase
VRTLEASGFTVRPYQATVPSFGIWGFALARVGPFALPSELPTGLRYLTLDILPGLFAFSADMSAVDVEINRLNDQRLVHYYEGEWRRYE